MAKVEITETQLEDVWAFDDMRVNDANEVKAIGDFHPLTAVMASWATSPGTRTARIDGRVAAVFGCAVHPESTLLAPMGIAWCLTTRVVDRYPKTFYSESIKIVREMSGQHGVLINYVPTWYRQALNWACRIGFRVLPPVYFTPKGDAFNPIIYGG